MSTVEERFQAMLAKRKKNKIEEKEEKSEEVAVVSKGKNKKTEVAIQDIFEIDKSIFGNLTEDNELLDYLEKKSIEMLSIQSKNLILLGKNLTEVFEELGRKGSPEGLYIKYLEVNGYKKDTALRLRKRYELFCKAKDEKLKKVISILSIRYMEQFYKNQEELFSQIEKNEKDITYKNVVEIIESKKEKIVELEHRNIESIQYDMGDIEILYKKINSSFDKLDNRKKERLGKLLQEIDKILS